jgi:hypothetical protein
MFRAIKLAMAKLTRFGTESQPTHARRKIREATFGIFAFAHREYDSRENDAACSCRECLSHTDDVQTGLKKDPLKTPAEPR